jgi:ribosomal protein L1
MISDRNTIESIITAAKKASVKNFEETLDLNLFIDKKSKKVLKLSKLDVLLDQAVNNVWYITNSLNSLILLAKLVGPKEFALNLEEYTAAGGNTKILRVLVDPLVVVSFLKTTSKVLSNNKIKPIVGKLDRLESQVRELSMTKTFKLSGPNLQLKIGRLGEDVTTLTDKILELSMSVAKSLSEDYSVGKGIIKTTMGVVHNLEK